MLGLSSVWAWLGIVAMAIVLAVVFQLTPTARLKRRLRRTHSRIVSTSRRRTVKFSAKVPRDAKQPGKSNKS